MTGLPHHIARVEHHQPVGLLVFVGGRRDVWQGAVLLGWQFDTRDHTTAGTGTDTTKDIKRTADLIQPLWLRAHLNGRLRIGHRRTSAQCQLYRDGIHPVRLIEGYDTIAEPGVIRITGRCHQLPIGENADAHLRNRASRKHHLVVDGIIQTDIGVGPIFGDQYLAFVIVGDDHINLRGFAIVGPVCGRARSIDRDGQRLPLAVLRNLVVDSR